MKSLPRSPEPVHGGDVELAAFLAQLKRLHPVKIDLALDRVEALLSKLGRPQDQLPPMVHVAGTNGKGSTVAFLKAMLEADGLRVHTLPRHISRAGNGRQYPPRIDKAGNRAAMTGS